MWLIFMAYLLPGAMAAPAPRNWPRRSRFRHGERAVRARSVSARTVHPKTTVASTLGPGMRGPFWFSVLAFMGAFALLLATRVRLEARRHELDALYLSLED